MLALYLYIKSFFQTQEKGQDIAEYGLLIALIALAIVAAFAILSGGLSTFFSNIGAYFSGLTVP